MAAMDADLIGVKSVSALFRPALLC